MSLTPRLEEKYCFIACSEDKVKHGLCDCINRTQNGVLNMPIVVKPFYCQSDNEDNNICDSQCEHCKEYDKTLE